MSKVTSADCKAYIVEGCYPGTEAKDWKRRKAVEVVDVDISM